MPQSFSFPYMLLIDKLLENRNIKELAAGKYRAQQVPGAVVIFAEGWHDTMGYSVWFERSTENENLPTFILWQEPPVDYAGQMLTPFTVWVMFETNEIVDKVIVRDANGDHELEVEQTPDIKASSKFTRVYGNVSRVTFSGGGGGWSSGG